MNQEIQKGIRINKKTDTFIKERMKKHGDKQFKKYFMRLLEVDGYNITLEDV